MSDRASEIQTIFNNIAPVYDNLNDSLSLGLHRVWKLMTVKWSQAKTGDTCIDLCCGSGDLSQILAQQVGNSGKVYGVDFSAELLAIAKQRSQNHYPPQAIEWVEADVLHLPFPDNHFDCATMGYGLRNVTDIPQALRELYRILKPGATAAILDFHRPYNPLMQNLQQWYLKNIVVAAAQNFGLTEEYAYISPSLDKFPQGRQQVNLAQQAGFTTATHYQILGGMMGVLQITN